MRRAPDPLEWHPFYRDHTWLLGWLSGPGGSHCMLVARLEPLRITAMEDDPYGPMPEPWTLTKRKAFGLAPYVGRPFVYVWYFAADQLGRAIAGDSWIVYTVDDMTWVMRSDTPA